jgi:hypothetical protein
VYDGVLVIGNVRLPVCEDAELGELLGAMGGRYAAGEMPAPPPKPAKATPPVRTSSTPPQVPPPNARGVRYSADPNVRMRQLLQQSEDLRKVGEDWRRFWFNDEPHHLTPERIHGGIF